jgi:regulatory protein
MPDPELFKKAKNQALKYLSYRDRSKWEITQYLEKKQHSHLVIQQTLEYLENLDYVDDQRFAMQWGQFNINKKKLGRNRLYRELLNKGIDRETLENILRTLYENNPEVQLAKECASKKWESLKGVEEDKKKRRLFQHLKRRGFPTDIIYQSLIKLDMEINNQTSSILDKS